MLPADPPALPTASTALQPGVGTLVLHQHPAPVAMLIYLAVDAVTSLSSPAYNRVPRHLYAAGWSVCAIDCTAHGADRRLTPEEPLDGLTAWRQRVVAGESLTAPFVARLRTLITLLLAAGHPDRLVLAGMSRGGYLALHGLAWEARLLGGLALMPPTDLGLLTEFAGFDCAGFDRHHARHLAGRLVDRPLHLSIGATDTRVSTASALRLSGAIAEAAERAGEVNRCRVDVSTAPDHEISLAMETAAVAFAEGLL